MIRATSLALAATLATFSAHAVDPGHWFEVEVYIFKRDAQAQEHWSEKVKPVSLRGNVDLISPIILTEHVLRPAVSCMHDDPISQLHDLTRSLMDDCVSQEPILQKRYPKVTTFEIGQPEHITSYMGESATLLGYSQNQFKSLIHKVERQNGVHNLLHMTWQQPMLSKRNAKAVHLFAGNDYSTEYHPDGFPVKQPLEQTETPHEFVDPTNSQVINADNIQQNKMNNQNSIHKIEDSVDKTSKSEPEAEIETKPVWELDGKLNIYLQHYLYIQADLRLRTLGLLENSLTDDEELSLAEHKQNNTEHVKPAQHFLLSIPMIQNRRVRSGEIHYFDHPKMGMFIQIRKMEQPEEKPIDSNEMLPTSIEDSTTISES